MDVAYLKMFRTEWWWKLRVELVYFESNSGNPYQNLAIEDLLLKEVSEKSECSVLYLWSNSDSIILGRNQNAYIECRIEELKKNRISLVRRNTGGGAVYHDLGNLNFTFITDKCHYDLNKNMRIIINALQKFGIAAQCSSRNDLTVAGYKVSGSAFYSKHDVCLHHGTLLIDCNIERMNYFLTANQSKLQKNGVISVKERVKNLKDFSQLINVKNIKEVIKDEFCKEWGKLEVDKECRLLQKDIELLSEKYSMEEWILGRRISSDLECNIILPWGIFRISFIVSKNQVIDCEIYTDDMDVDFVDYIKRLIVKKTLSQLTDIDEWERFSETFQTNVKKQKSRELGFAIKNELEERNDI